MILLEAVRAPWDGPCVAGECTGEGWWPTNPDSSRRVPPAVSTCHRLPSAAPQHSSPARTMKACYENSSGAFSGNLVARSEAMKENFSTHVAMSWIGGRAGRGGCPGTGVGRLSNVISDISTNSRSMILTTLAWRMAAGLYGPLPCNLVVGLSVGA